MQLHTIKRNDSLWNLSKHYGVPIGHITEVNEINDSDTLIVGQALIIPSLPSTKTHKVQTGETLWTIARQYGLTINQLLAVNSIYNPAVLSVGQFLTIPTTPRTEIEVNGFITSTDDAAVREIEMHAEYLTYGAVFSYRIQEDGSLQSLDDENLLQSMFNHNVAPMMTITNLTDEGFSSELIHKILNDQATYYLLIENISTEMQAKGFKAINIDLEYIPVEDRERYNQFLRDITARLHQYNYIVSSALAPKTHADQPGALYEGHDYRAHGEIVDFVILMTYEWGWTGGPPLPVAPINEVNKVVTYALSEIPAHKIMLGVPLYGYRWTLPYIEGTSQAVALNTPQAIQLARVQKAEIEYDETAQSPHFSFYDENNQENIVWFEDARSLQAKFNLVKQYNLRGISYWKLGIPAEANWYLLGENFIVTKLAT